MENNTEHVGVASFRVTEYGYYVDVGSIFELK